MNHDLKTWPEYFWAVADGSKTFEVRKNDRDFKKGDSLLLREWDPKTSEYSGARIHADVTYVLTGKQSILGIPEDIAVLGIKTHGGAQWVIGNHIRGECACGQHRPGTVYYEPEDCAICEVCAKEEGLL